ncbi:MAG: VWA domain-containing protein [Pyrinomonadaceae bacterium]
MTKAPLRLLPIVLLICVFAATSVYAQDDPDSDETITFDSSLVILNASVTDQSGEFRTDLGAKDFEVFEEGKKQEIAFVESGESPFAVAILVDVSGSMERMISLARSAAIRFLEGIRDTDSVAIFAFESKVTKVRDFSSMRDPNAKFFDLKASGQTVLNDAVVEAVEALSERNEKRKAIIVLSDGADTRSKSTSDRALKKAQEADVTIYTVDMSPINSNSRDIFQNRMVLRRFAQQTGGTFIKSPGGIALRDAFGTVVSELGRQYTIGYYPENQKKDGKWRKIRVVAAKSGYSIRTREGYYAEKK